MSGSPSVDGSDVASTRRPGASFELFPVALAAGAWIGAVVARPAGWLAAGAVVVALAWPRRVLMCLAVLLLAGTLGARAETANRPVSAAAFNGPVTLVADPVHAAGQVHAEVRVPGGTRLELRAATAGAGGLREALAGERFAVRGRIRPRAPGDDRARVRHVRGTLEVERLSPLPGGPVRYRAANAVRSVIGRGARALPGEQRDLYLGLVVGDDRGLDPLTGDDFRAAGLSHLTAVSGQNVAFVLAVSAPVLGRLRRRARMVGVVVVLVFFATLTRFEPSVLRAAVMAGIAVGAGLAGHPIATWRALCLTVTALVLVDPLITGSLGFQLSVAACAAIVGLARPLDAVLVGPRWLTMPLSVTVAAQAAVTPLLAPLAGPVPLSAVLANLAAMPAAGPVMAWGLTVGLLAGLVPTGAAGVLLLPTQLLLGWLSGVARLGGAHPIAWISPGAVMIGLAGLVALGACTAAGGGGARVGRRVALASAAVATLVAVLAPVRPAPGSTGLGPGAVLEVGGGARVVVVDGRARVEVVLARLRRVGVHRVDLVAARTDSPAGARVASIVASRLRVAWVRPGDGPGRLPPGTTLTIGTLLVTVTSGADHRPAIEVSQRPV